MTYSVFMNGLKKAEIAVDRKVLADIAVLDKPAFAKFVEKAKAQPRRPEAAQRRRKGGSRASFFASAVHAVAWFASHA